jgi:hypothetical protein
MNPENDTDRRLRSWLVQGIDEAPERIVWSSLETIEFVEQRRPLVPVLDDLGRRLRPASGLVRLLAVAALLLIALLLAGIFGVGDRTPTTRLFEVADLERIVVWENTKPADWRLDSLNTTSHQVATLPVRTVPGDQHGQMTLPKGYLTGRHVEFSAPVSAHASWAALFATSEDADAALEFYRNEMASPDGWGVGPGEPVDLGEEGTVYTGETRRFLIDVIFGDPVPMRLYLWRDGNLLLALGGWDAYDRDLLRAVAEGMDARAG